MAFQPERWEYQSGDVVDAGFRLLKYDRHGFGKSSKPWLGYDFDMLASALNELITRLDLNKVTLVGFSLGGGEVARYIWRYGQDRFDRVVLISTVLPYLLKTKENPDGVDKHVFDQMKDATKNDRIGFLADFGKLFFGISLINHPRSDALLSYYGELASHATQQSTLACVTSFAETDFKGDFSKIAVPSLIIHGEADKGTLRSQQRTHCRIAPGSRADRLPGRTARVILYAPRVTE
jgi:non-heme chloroperoxidase